MAPRKLTIIHFNDVYNIEPFANEPVGGAARLVHKVTSRTATSSSNSDRMAAGVDSPARCHRFLLCTVYIAYYTPSLQCQ
jgi:hypothetical protein